MYNLAHKFLHHLQYTVINNIMCAVKTPYTAGDASMCRESDSGAVESVFVPRFSRDARDSDAEHSSDDELSESASADELRLPWNHDADRTLPQPRRFSWCLLI